MGINAAQYQTLMRPLKTNRIAKRSQGGKQLSYLESWDVKAHLTRIFGFGNYDEQVLECYHVANREYESTGQNPKPMIEVIWFARVRLEVRDPAGEILCEHIEGACGSASGPANMLGEHHDNALKTAASDAIKRCAINLGSQFGLSLYDNGSTREVIRATVVTPQGVGAPETDAQDSDGGQSTQEAQERLEHSLGATEVTPTEEGERTNEGGADESGDSDSEPAEQHKQAS